MEKKTASPSIMKLALVLLAAAAIVALVLGLVNHVTKDRIAQLAAEKTATAYANVLEAAGLYTFCQPVHFPLVHRDFPYMQGLLHWYHHLQFYQKQHHNLS